MWPIAGCPRARHPPHPSPHRSRSPLPKIADRRKPTAGEVHGRWRDGSTENGSRTMREAAQISRQILEPISAPERLETRLGSLAFPSARPPGRRRTASTTTSATCARSVLSSTRTPASVCGRPAEDCPRRESRTTRSRWGGPVRPAGSVGRRRGPRRPRNGPRPLGAATAGRPAGSGPSSPASAGSRPPSAPEQRSPDPQGGPAGQPARPAGGCRAAPPGSPGRSRRCPDLTPCRIGMSSSF